MEKGINAYIQAKFEIEPKDVRSYSPLTLAYIGDAIFDLVIRSVIVGRGNSQVNKLHQKACRIVKASAQSKMIELLMPELTEEERSIYRRGRNAHSVSMPKNAAMSDYRKATGYEALLGYLYLTDQTDRIFTLIQNGLIKADERI